MIFATSLARAFLGAVLVISALGKVGDLGATTRAVASYGLTGRAARYLAVGLPALELLVGALLLLQVGPVLVPAWATLLFTAFLLAIVRVIRQGGSMRCHCFGTLTEEEVSKLTATRAAALALLSAGVSAAEMRFAHGAQITWNILLGGGQGVDIFPVGATGTLLAASVILGGQLKSTLRVLSHG